MAARKAWKFRVSVGGLDMCYRCVLIENRRPHLPEVGEIRTFPGGQKPGSQVLRNTECFLVFLFALSEYTLS